MRGSLCVPLARFQIVYLVQVFVLAKHAQDQHELLNARALKTTSDPSFVVEVERWPVR
jgi:hypothetical protein